MGQRARALQHLERMSALEGTHDGVYIDRCSQRSTPTRTETLRRMTQIGMHGLWCEEAEKGSVPPSLERWSEAVSVPAGGDGLPDRPRLEQIIIIGTS